MEEFEHIVVETTEEAKQQHDQPEEVVIILPDESCFEYEPAKKARTDGTKVTWTKEQTHMLIEEYKNNKQELENPVTTKSVIWEKIAEKFNERWSTNFSADSCANKWRSMKNTYKRVRFSKRSDASKKRWEYYNALSEVYRGMKLTKSNYRLLGDQQQQPVHIVQFAPQGSMTYGAMSPDAHAFESDGEPPKWYRDFLKEYRNNEEMKLKTLHKIHIDIVRLGERQCAALEKLCQKLKN